MGVCLCGGKGVGCLCYCSILNSAWSDVDLPSAMFNCEELLRCQMFNCQGLLRCQMFNCEGLLLCQACTRVLRVYHPCPTRLDLQSTPHELRMSACTFPFHLNPHLNSYHILFHNTFHSVSYFIQSFICANTQSQRHTRTRSACIRDHTP